MNYLPRLLVLASLCAAATFASASYSFTLLNGLSSQSSSFTSISRDGRTAVGYGFLSSGNPEAIRWNSTYGVIPMGDIDQNSIYNYAFGCSTNGAVIVGQSHNSAFRWQGGIFNDISVGNKFTFTSAKAASADASVIVGEGVAQNSNQYVPARWTSLGGGVIIPPFFGGGRGTATCVSADGSVIGGHCEINGILQPFRWTAAQGMVKLPIPDDMVEGHVFGMSSDGSYLVGSVIGPNHSPQYPVRWYLNKSCLVIAPDIQYAAAEGVSDDGNVIVGVTTSPNAFIWTNKTGFWMLPTYLTKAGVDMGGAIAGGMYGLSADGRSMAGFGQLNGVTRPAVATIDLPPDLRQLAAPAQVLSGASTSAKVYLTAKTVVDAVVKLKSADTTILSTPNTVTVPGGSNTGVFLVHGFAVATDKSVLLTASYFGVTKTATVIVKMAVLASVTATKATLKAGESTYGRAILTGTVPSAMTVALSSSNPAALSVPSSVLVPKSNKVSAAFGIASHPVASSTVVTITATYKGVSKTVQVTVNP